VVLGGGGRGRPLGGTGVAAEVGGWVLEGADLAGPGAVSSGERGGWGVEVDTLVGGVGWRKGFGCFGDGGGGLSSGSKGGGCFGLGFAV